VSAVFTGGKGGGGEEIEVAIDIEEQQKLLATIRMFRSGRQSGRFVNRGTFTWAIDQWPDTMQLKVPARAKPDVCPPAHPQPCTKRKMAKRYEGTRAKR
jgi:hypothetical protein